MNIIDDVGVTCVMVTHDQEEAMTMASRIAVMSEGRFLQVGAPAEIYETPASRFVADFIGNVNLIDGTLVEDERRTTSPSTAATAPLRRPRHRPARRGMPVTVALRPEKIRIARATPRSRRRPQPAFNRARGTVKDMAYSAASPSTTCAAERRACSRSARATPSASADAPLTWGDAAWASWSTLAPVVLTQ